MSCWHQHLTLGDSVAELMLQDTARRLHGACARAPSRIITHGEDGGVEGGHCVCDEHSTHNEHLLYQEHVCWKAQTA